MRFDTCRQLAGIRAGRLGRTLAILLLLIQIGFWQLGRPSRRVHADTQKPRIWLAPAARHNAQFRGDLPSRFNAVSMAADDFDGDGVTDLAVGYAGSGPGRIAIFRGNLDAFAPQSDASFRAIARSEFP